MQFNATIILPNREAGANTRAIFGATPKCGGKIPNDLDSGGTKDGFAQKSLKKCNYLWTLGHQNAKKVQWGSICRPKLLIIGK
jgi:hypothetical protein